MASFNGYVVQDRLPRAEVPPPPPCPPPFPPSFLPSDLGAVAEATLQSAASMVSKNPSAAPLAPSTLEVPIPSFAEASTPAWPSYGWGSYCDVPSHRGAPFPVQSEKVHDVKSCPKQEQKHGFDAAVCTESQRSSKDTERLTIKILRIPGSWSQNDLPDFVENLGIDKHELRYAAIHRDKENDTCTSTHAYFSFCSANSLQQFKDIFSKAAVAGTLGALSIGTMDKLEHRKLETSYQYRKLMKKRQLKRPDGIPRPEESTSWTGWV